MSITRVSFILDGKQITPPRNWRDVKVLATFDNNTNQATVTTDRWEFVNSNEERVAALLAARFRSGLTGGPGAFEGPEFKINVSDDQGATNVFDGLLNFVRDYEERNFKDPNFENPTECLASAEMIDSLNGVDDLISGTTVALMESEGVFKDSDYTGVDWVIEKPFDFYEVAILSIGVFSVSKEVIDALSRLGDDISIPAGIAASGALGTAGAALYKILIIIFRIAYIVFMLVQLIQLATQLIRLLIPKTRTHKGIKLGTLYRKGFEYFGYTFVSNIPELDKYVYLPTLPTQESNFADKLLSRIKVIEKGIPSVQDYGYLFSESVQLGLQMFYARIAVVGTEVHMRTEDDPWWFKQSTKDVIDDVLVNSVKFNLEDLKRSNFIKFATDPSDQFTIDNYSGTSYEVQTLPQSIKDEKKVRITGVDEVSIPLALGTRKGTLSFLEEAALTFLGAAETAVNAIGGNLNLTSEIKNRVNILKVSNPLHSVPKILYWDGNGIPEDHRDKLSAKALWDNYHFPKDFRANNFKAQKIKFENVKVPFNLRGFKELMKNPYFITKGGVSGKIEKMEWTLDGDYATVSGWFRKIYTKNLRTKRFNP